MAQTGGLNGHAGPLPRLWAHMIGSNSLFDAAFALPAFGKEDWGR